MERLRGKHKNITTNNLNRHNVTKHDMQKLFSDLEHYKYYVQNNDGIKKYKLFY